MSSAKAIVQAAQLADVALRKLRHAAAGDQAAVLADVFLRVMVAAEDGEREEIALLLEADQATVHMAAAVRARTT